MERLEILIEFLTQQSVRDIGGLVDAINTLRQASNSLSPIVSQADVYVSKIGTSSTEASQGIKQLGDAGSTATLGIKAAGEASKEASTNVNELRNKTDEAKGSLSAVDGVLDNMAGSLQTWITGFAGIAGVKRIIDDLLDKMNEMRQAQDDLAQKRLGMDELAHRAVDAFGLSDKGQPGFDKALAVIQSLAKDTSSKQEDAATIAAAAQTSGIKVVDEQGNVNQAGYDTAKSVGQFASRTGVDARTSENIFKLAQNLGVSDQTGMNSLLSKLEAASKGVANRSQFVGAAIDSIIDPVAKGASFDEAMAQFSSAAKGERTARTAGSQVEKYWRVVQGENPETTKALTDLYAKSGLIRPGTVGDADIDAAMARGDDPKAKAAATARDRFNETKAASDREASDYATRADQNVRKSGEARTPHERENLQDAMHRLDEEHARKTSENAAKLAKANKETSDARSALQSELGGKSDMAAFASASLMQKQAMLNDLAKMAESDPALKQSLLAALGPGGDAVLRQISPAYQKRAADAVANIERSSGATQGAAYETYSSTNIAKSQQQDVQQSEKDAALRPDSQAVFRLHQAAQREKERMSANGEFRRKWYYSADKELAVASEKVLLDQMKNYYDSLTDGEKAAFGITAGEEKQAIDISIVDTPLAGTMHQNAVDAVARTFEQRKAKVEAMRKRTGTSNPGISPASQPSSGTSPRADAGGDIHHHNETYLNVSIGQNITRPGASTPYDLPTIAQYLDRGNIG